MTERKRTARKKSTRQGTIQTDGMQFASAKYVAELLQVSTKHVYRLGERGELKRARVGALWRYDLDSVKAMLQGSA